MKVVTVCNVFYILPVFMNIPLVIMASGGGGKAFRGDSFLHITAISQKHEHYFIHREPKVVLV